MSLETHIRECCAGLTSDRVTERKKSADTLKTFLSGDAAPSLLVENTVRKRGFSWDDLYEHVQDYILKEMENYEKSKTFENVTKPLASSLLHMTVAGSIKGGRGHIKCEKITNSCLFILKNHRLTKGIGDAYLNLLYKYVISNDYYVGFISQQTWEELLEVCLSASGSSYSKLDLYTKLRLVCILMLNGSKCCQFTNPLRDSLPQLQKLFLNPTMDKKVQEVTIEIMLLLVQKLSTEYRLAMCEFTEGILGMILSFYDQNLDKKKSLLFKLLHMTVMLHHPQGKLQAEDGSLAYNWNNWNKHLFSITEIIHLEVKVMQKSSVTKFRIKDGDVKDCRHFYSLAASVFYQIFNGCVVRNQNEDGSNASKRQKLSACQNKDFSDLVEELRQNQVSWLGIIAEYIKQYGGLTPAAQYPALLRVLDGYISSTNPGKDWPLFEELSCNVLTLLTAQTELERARYDAVCLSLWNSCVRHAALGDNVHKAMHGVLQCLLRCGIINFENVQSLVKPCYERAMPVTDYSVKTLAHIIHVFFAKYNNASDKEKAFRWFAQGEVTCTDMTNVQDFLLRLVSNENFDLEAVSATPATRHVLYETLFDTIDKCILFSEFQLSLDDGTATQTSMKSVEINRDAESQIRKSLGRKLNENCGQLKQKQIKLIEFAQFVKVVLNYCHLLIKYTKMDANNLIETDLYINLKKSLKLLFLCLTTNLQNCADSTDDLRLIGIVQSILTSDYEAVLNSEIRMAIEADFFQPVHNVISSTSPNDDRDQDMDDLEDDLLDMRRLCIHLLAAYCRHDTRFRQDILELIMNKDLYNFRHNADIKCALQCMTMLVEHSVQNAPYESVLGLMFSMCRELFRNSEVTGGLLKILLLVLDGAWPTLSAAMKQNCHIMVDRYLAICKNLFYPPEVAALIYECAVKIEVLAKKEDPTSENKYKERLIAGTTGDINCMRLYCCYLLKQIASDYDSADVQLHIAGALELFVINVADKSEQMQKDELANRTLTVLHGFYALAQSKPSLINSVIKAILKVQKEKTLDEALVKKVLNKIVNDISGTGINAYLNNNLLSILHFWFAEKYKLDDLPIYLFGFNDMTQFLENNVKWVIPAEILWCKQGSIHESQVMQKLQRSSNLTVQNYVESCFSTFIILVLPYIVTDKYNLEYEKQENPLAYAQSAKNAQKMFRETNQIVGSKFGDLFFEKMGDLVLLSASHLADFEDVNNMYELKVPKPTETFYYPKAVYSAVLKYFGDVTNDDIMKFLCEQHPMVISKIILKLWGNVLQETILERKSLALHAFLTFIECLRFGYNADHFVCNFACNSLLHGIKVATSTVETRVLLKSLHTLLVQFLPGQSELLRETMPLAVSVLTCKKEEEFGPECRATLDLVLSADHTDGTSFASQRQPKRCCGSNTEFLDTLKTYVTSLGCPSYEVLCNLHQFLKANKEYISDLRTSLNFKGFSEDCDTSLLHQILKSLIGILTSASDNKTTIKVCNCISELGTFDLKTLVMAAPPDTKTVVDLKPAQYFAIVVLKSLARVLVGEAPAVVSKVMGTLARLLKYREGKIAFDLGEVDQQVLRQFLSSKSNYIQAKFRVNEDKFNAYSRTDFWLPTDNESHKEWICRITVTLLNIVTSGENYLATLGVVCKAKPNLSQNILPPLIGLLLSISNDTQITVVSNQINSFLNFFWDKTFNNSSSDSNGGGGSRHEIDHDQKMIIRDVLEVVNFVRLQRIHYNKRPDDFESLNYLKLDYDMASWAAAISDNSLAALYYGELWALAQNEGVPPGAPDATAALPGGENVQRIFRKCYTSIGETDAIDGCGSGHLTSELEKRKHLINTGQYTDALLFHDIALSHGTDQDDVTLQYGVVKSLYKSGMHHLALQYINSLPENDKLDDVKYECLAFLGDWSVFVDSNETENKLNNPNTNMNSLLKELRYASLKDCLNLQLQSPDFEDKLIVPLNRAKMAVSKLSQKLNMDNCQSVYTVVSQLQMFNDLEAYHSVRGNKTPMTELLRRWQVQKLAPFQDFKHVETLISQRSIILEHASRAYANLSDDIVNLQLKYTELGLSNERIQLSQRLLAMAKRCKTSGEVALVESQIFWAKGHKEIALSLLSNVTNSQEQNVKLTATALRQYGLWMAESKRENARDIIDKYLQRSLQVLGAGEDADIRLKVYSDIAKFADTEYKQVVTYMKSPKFENKVKCMENMKGTASCLRSTQQSLTKDERKAMVTNEKLSLLDEAEIHSTIAEKKRFLELAMKYYLLSLKQSEDNNLSVFRIISLWLENQDLEFDDRDGGSFESLLRSVPSRKYVAVLPQLAPRLTNYEDAFSKNLNEIILRCSKDHPHHTLPILFGLKNSDKDHVILNASAGAAGAGAAVAGRARGGSDEPRVVAAAALLRQVSQADNELKSVIAQMERMCDAIISFANYTSKAKEQRQAVPKSEPLSKLKDLSDIPIPTINLPIRKDCKYTDFPAIVSFDNKFDLVGGINCPKKMTCKGSDGRERTILIKGEDDLRQDAVMQQVFSIVNTLLEINPVTARNKLLIRTYKVVPLSRRSGVLEWCEGTVPLGLYLAGTHSAPGAHRLYRPKDISPNMARSKMTACHTSGRSNSVKLATFQSILREFRPVFHYFFTEHYHDPVAWYERRLAYTKSVATSSMVGYIMGLGDRHVQNILVDKRTAEVIHIDFGIAFDQGKALPTPETIPFRLTQDIIAGFGCSGVEGVFRRCCEKTMQVLRDNHEALLTILEVLLCDPLYCWSITPAQANRKQNVLASGDTTLTVQASSGLAERALLAVASKLSGTEGGVAGGVAVPGQVARLVHAATDPANLSRLFPGWQPYL
ncbi:serine-protein kinase ATM [Plutella xylostella]|uniref:serine-protein kinase ATM n=1 Tax=Plutella xylostella TaxID=51655 RepID=UPI0020326703|nr:serine-protein kinase ATM [Plutella xylostella]